MAFILAGSFIAARTALVDLLTYYKTRTRKNDIDVRILSRIASQLARLIHTAKSISRTSRLPVHQRKNADDPKMAFSSRISSVPLHHSTLKTTHLKIRHASKSPESCLRRRHGEKQSLVVGEAQKCDVEYQEKCCRILRESNNSEIYD